MGAEFANLGGHLGFYTNLQVMKMDSNNQNIPVLFVTVHFRPGMPEVRLSFGRRVLTTKVFPFQASVFTLEEWHN
jgi:hypothetical protein